MLILDPWGISFHAVVVFALGKNFLFKSALGHCEVIFQLNQLVLVKISPIGYLIDKKITVQSCRINIRKQKTKAKI